MCNRREKQQIIKHYLKGDETVHFIEFEKQKKIEVQKKNTKNNSCIPIALIILSSSSSHCCSLACTNICNKVDSVVIESLSLGIPKLL